MHPFRSRVPVAVLAVLAIGCSAAPRSFRATAPLRPIPVARIAVVPPQAVVTGGEAGSALRFEARLASRIAAEVSRRGRDLGGVQFPPDADRVERIRKALADSPVYVHREFVGVASPKPRGRLAATDVAAFASSRRADAVLVARLVATVTSAGGRAADSALSFVQGAALGVVSLSPSRIVRAAVNAPNASPGSHLRVALVDPASGEILWANWVIVKSSPTAELIDELVALAFADFPVPA